MPARKEEKDKFCQRERARKINIASKRKRGGERQSLPKKGRDKSNSEREKYIERNR